MMSNVLKSTLRQTLQRLGKFLFEDKDPILIYVISRVLVFGVTFLIAGNNFGPVNWHAWDGAAYLHLAQFGYTPGPIANDGVLIAFLPLYPIAIRMVSVITHLSFFMSALSVSFVFGLFGVILLYKLAKAWKGSDCARATTLLFAFFPWSFFLSAPYTESLFLFLTLVSILLLNTKYLVLAAFTIALASITRLTGLLLLPLLLYQLWQQRVRLAPSVLSLFVASSTFFSYLLFQYQNYGTPWAFLQAQKINWYHSATFPWKGLASLWHFGHTASDAAFMWRTDFAVALVIITTLIMSYRRIPRLLWWFGLGVVLLTFSSNFILGTSRYLMMVFPFFFYWGWQLSQRPLILNLLVAVSAGWLGFNTLLFVLQRHIY